MLGRPQVAGAQGEQVSSCSIWPVARVMPVRADLEGREPSAEVASSVRTSFPTCRGTYRTSPAKWFHPSGSVPHGSSVAGGAMRTPMARAPGGGGGWQVQLRFAAELAPLTLAFTVHVPAVGSGGLDLSVAARSKRPFAVPIGMGAGSPELLGGF